MSDLIIDVTQEDIDEGEPMSPFDCPIALAVRRKTRRKHVAVALGRKHIECGHKLLALDIDALKFGWAFDLGKPVKPQRFVFKAIL